MFHIDSRAALNDRDLDLKGGGGGACKSVLNRVYKS